MTNYNFQPTECDIVLEGGITSGVVYPSFIAGLAAHFRLRSIGGTSVGAIAAVAAAAAQFKRNASRGKESNAPETVLDDGFEKLAKLPLWLQEDSALGKSNLFTLFQPCAALGRHFNVLQAALNHPGKLRTALGVASSLVAQFPLGAVAGALILAILRWVIPADFYGWIVALVWAVVGLVLGAVSEFVVTAWGGLQKNKFGICPGIRLEQAHPPALTEWLHEYVQGIAGLPLSTPLTFGQLNNSQPSIDLALMTTGLSENRAHRLPYASRDLVFRASELKSLFSKDVVAWMSAHALHPDDLGTGGAQVKSILRANDSSYGTEAQDYFLMPVPDNLPIVVAARMSLSFPILLQAVPLYRLRFPVGGLGEGGTLALMRVWFSDGGLTANFPIHFFDSLLPMRPTFGVTLANTLKQGAPACKRAYLPTNNLGGITRGYVVIENGGKPSIGSFIAAILGTMRIWRDEALRRTPGFRDRVVQIRHTKQEGGLNLNMPKEAIKSLSESGVLAAKTVIDRFLSPDYTTNGWVNHRWVRMRSAAGLLQETLKPVADSLTSASQDPTYEALWNNTGSEELSAYELNAKQREYGKQFWAGLAAAAANPNAVDLNDRAPSPRPSLTIGPKQT